MIFGARRQILTDSFLLIKFFLSHTDKELGKGQTLAKEQRSYVEKIVVKQFSDKDCSVQMTESSQEVPANFADKN